MRHPPTGTVTFLFTDIQGSTKLWEQHPDQMRPALARHDQLLRQAIEGNNGYVFKTVGDAFCAAFPTAPDALQATLSAQQSLEAEVWDLPSPLLVRMALHTGAAEERDGDYFGQPLNRVARLMAVGHGGQTLLSGATQELTRDHLPEAMALLDLGQRRLKDLGRPEHVYQSVHPSLPSEFPPLRSLDNPELPNNLPQQVTSFIGRETQVEEVTRLLGRTHLLTLTGAGGCGKTRLSLQVAVELLDQYFDGVWLVELAALSDPALVPQAVATALGVKEEPGKPLSQTLLEALKPKRLLIVLDNCEHVVAACAALATDLLRSCPQVRILASSRQALNVSGEQTFRVPSLTLPDPKQPQTVEGLSQYEAVTLFIERAQAVQPSFAVTTANAPAMAQVCFHLDGIPLAIELAAARVRSLAVEEINTRLDNRFRLLTSGSRTALPRQQTLRALIDWSYDLLTEPEKALLCRLSVFAGGWTLSAAEVVCVGVPVEDWEVLDLLTGLVDKSLVVYEEGVDRQGRFRLLETVRQYAGDRLQESGTSEEGHGRAASWFLALAEEAEPQMIGPEQAIWLERLETEHDNLRTSLSWYEKSAAGVEAGIRLAGALWRLWWTHGHFSEGRQRLGKALGRTSGQEGATGLEALAARGKAFNGAGNLALRQGDYAAARALFEESLAIGRQLGNQQGIASSLNNLGNVTFNQGDYAEAQALHEESLTLFRRLENQHGIASSLNNLGRAAFGQGDYVEAQALHDESLALFQRLGNQQGVASSLNNLGNVASNQGDYAEAQALHEKSLAIGRQLGNQPGIAHSLTNLGGLALRQGDYAAARALFEESLAIGRQLGNQQGIAENLEGMAEVAYGLNQSVRSAQLWGSASSLRDTIGGLLPPAEQEEMEKRVSSGRTALGDAAFTAAWDAGRAMALDEAVEYALEDTPDGASA